MSKLVALIVSVAFAFSVGLAIPPTFAQTPAPKDEKKGDVKMEKKTAKKKDEKKTAKKTEKKAADKKDEKK